MINTVGRKTHISNACLKRDYRAQDLPGVKKSNTPIVNKYFKNKHNYLSPLFESSDSKILQVSNNPFCWMISKNFITGIIFTFLFVLLWIDPSPGQTREDLESEKRQIEREILLTNQMIRENQETADVTLDQLTLINKSIENRESLINKLSEQINQINSQINKTIAEIQKLEEELEALKDSYARLILYAHKNRSSYQRIMFIFASRDFNQAYLRLKYFQKLAQHRRIQAEKIELAKQKLAKTKSELEIQKQQQQNLLEEERLEMKELTQEKETQKQKIKQLRQKENQLKQQLKNQQQTARELQREIERIIEEERRRVAEKAKEEGKESIGLSPEDQLLSDEFAENKGKLPWPVERGIITGFFGEQPHPVLPGIKIPNNGIDISTTRNSDARAIFSGTVTRITSIAGFNYVVIIRHGNFLSVYANLSEIYVETGQKISTKQQIGRIATDDQDAKTFIHLEIWEGNNKLDPAKWIAASLP
ncbi:MAG: murein hydrolase activator EnvC family protein [Bacteroidota bacterium]